MKKILVLIEGIFLYYFGVHLAYAQTIVVKPPSNLKLIDPGLLISALVGIVLIISFLAAFIYLVIGGFRWITSGGDKAGVDAARNQIQAALLGLFIVFGAWAIMILVQNFLGIHILGGVIELPHPF